MIRNSDRKLAAALVRVGLWKIIQPRDDLFSCARLRPRKGTGWLWNWMRDRQEPDEAHHAPGCPANRWSGVELTLRPCTCGVHHAMRVAARAASRSEPRP